jgi:succinate-semialdehyde dehydrogenase/glutarate-semialdehyde dehydrogenase
MFPDEIGMKMFVDGKWIDSGSGATSDVFNPATGEVVDSVPKCGREDAKMAVDIAKDRFEKWSAMPPIERSKLLFKVSAAIGANLEGLAEMLTREQGKPLYEARSEMNGFVGCLEYYAGLTGRFRSIQIPFSSGEGYSIITKKPVGVVGAIVPWNFPVSLLGWKLAPGLSAGNTFVVKPASTTPLTDLKLAEVMTQAGLPAGVVNVVTGPGSVVGEELLENQKVSKIAFTGETGTGRRIMEGAAKSIKRITLELGGSDPMIVCDDADIDLAVEGATFGRFRNAGQICTSVKRLFLFDSIADDFVRKFVEKVRIIKLGNGLDPRTTMGPVHTEQQREDVEKMVEDAEERGARIIVGGRRPSGAEYDKGHFYEPTLLAGVDYNARIAREECFGPALPIFVVKSLEEAIERANDSMYGLGSSVWTKSLDRAYYASEMIEAGTTWVNSPPISRPEVPFGGFKQSGIGRELGVEGLEYYYETKTTQVYQYSKGKKWRYPEN